MIAPAQSAIDQEDADCVPFLQELADEGVEYYDSVERNMGREHLAQLGRKLLMTLQHAIEENKNLREENECIRTDIMIKGDEIEDLRNRLSLMEEEYQNLKILMSDQQQENQINFHQLSLSSSSMLEQLSCELTKQKQITYHYKQLARQYNAKQKEVNQLDSLLQKKQQYINQLREKQKKSEILAEMHKKLQNKHQVAREKNQKLCLEVNELNRENQELREVISELQDIIAHQRANQLVPSGSRRNLLNELDQIDTAVKLKEIQQNYEPNYLMGTLSREKSISQKTQNWEQSSIKAPDQSVNEDPISFDQKKTVVNHKTPNSVKNLDNHGLIASLRRISNSAIPGVNPTDSPSEMSIRERSRTNVQSSDIPTKRESSQIKEQQIKELEEEIKILSEQNLQRVFQISQLEGELEMAEDQKKEEVKKLEDENRGLNKVIASLNKIIKDNKMDHLNEVMEIKKQSKMAQERMKEMLIGAKALCEEYENVLDQYKKQHKKQKQNMCSQTDYLVCEEAAQTEQLTQEKVSEFSQTPAITLCDKQTNTQACQQKFSPSSTVSHEEARGQENEPEHHLLDTIQECTVQQKPVIQIPQFELVLEKDEFISSYPVDGKVKPQNKEIKKRIRKQRNSLTDEVCPEGLKEFKEIIEYDTDKYFGRDAPLPIKFKNYQNYCREDGEVSLKDVIADLSSQHKSQLKRFYVLIVKRQQDSLEQIANIDRILIWNQGIISENERKAIYMRKAKKFISDSGRCVLGNCEVTLEESSLLVRRAGKKNFFSGNFEDSTWMIRGICGWGEF